MKLQLIYLEKGAALYAGYGFDLPVLQWGGAGWLVFQSAKPKLKGWAVRLSERETERCFPGATTTARPDDVPDQKEFSVGDAMKLRPDLFDSYDPPYIRKSPDEQGEERAVTIARVQSLLAGKELSSGSV